MVTPSRASADSREDEMAETPDARGRATPWHLWVVGIVALLWSGMGAMDYVMTETRNEAYMSNFTQEQLDFFYGFPAWLIAAWAVGVWGGVLGSVLLLLKKKSAVPTFVASFMAMVITTVHNYGFSNGLEVIGGTFELIFSAVIFVVSVLLVVYARAMRGRGVLT